MAELTPSLESTLFVIVGPTAIGKTALSIELAKELSCPILSVDSRQFYKEMNIGTAKPSASELASAEHHFINSHSIYERFTAGKFESDALATLEKLFLHHKNIIAVGGSGLYVNALCYGVDDIPFNQSVRDEVNRIWEEKGLEELQQRVKKIDPEFFAETDIKNPRRLVRALEVFKISGQKYSTLRLSMKKNRPFNIKWIGLETERDELNQRINQRVDEMIENGQVDEVRSLLKHKQVKAMQTLGYQELVKYFDKDISLEEAIDKIKINTRRFAKRQMTWFKKNEDILWFNIHEKAKIMEYVDVNKSK